MFIKLDSIVELLQFSSLYYSLSLPNPPSIASPFLLSFRTCLLRKNGIGQQQSACSSPPHTAHRTAPLVSPRLLSASVSVDLTLLQACLSCRKQILRHKNMTFSHFTVHFFTIENGHVKFTFSQFAISLFTMLRLLVFKFHYLYLLWKSQHAWAIHSQLFGWKIFQGERNLITLTNLDACPERRRID